MLKKKTYFTKDAISYLEILIAELEKKVAILKESLAIIKPKGLM
jgi:hypothetical protein